MFNPVRVLIAYGFFLMSGGLIAFAMSGFEAKAKTAIIMGCGSGLVMCVCAYLGANGRPVALRVGRGLACFFLVLFAFRGWKIRDVAEKQYLLYTFIWLCAGSFIAAVLLSMSPIVSGAPVPPSQRLAAARAAKKE